MQDLLYLAHRIPYPPNKGDKIRSYHLLKYLSGHFRVYLGCFIDDPDDRQYITKIGALCAGTCFIDRPPLAARLRSLSGLVCGEPMSLAYYRDRRLQAWVERLLGGGTVKHALVFSGPMAQYLCAPGAAALHRVVDFVDVDSEKWRQYGVAKAWPLSLVYRREARCLLDYERSVALQFDAATFVSPAEAELFRRRAPQAADRACFFSNGVDAEYFSPQRAYDNPYASPGPVLVFTGAMDYWPNVEAVQWFARRVLPRLRLRFPDLQFWIVGARPSAPVTKLARLPGVGVTGAVPDVRPYLAHAALALAPLRIARGVQNKVLEAMSMQKIVLASPEALEGISAVPAREVLLARDENEFTALAARVLAGQAGAGLGLAARQRVLLDYCWSKNLQRLDGLLGLPHATADTPQGALL
jgi:sugar transferase (PEP-CTERM/EpsH1 system associated)